MRAFRCRDWHVGPWSRLDSATTFQQRCRAPRGAVGCWLDWGGHRYLGAPTRCGCGLALFRGQLWAVGGHDDEKNILSSCEYLDTASNTWMTGPPLNHSRCFLGLAVLDGDLWAVGGGGTAEGEAVSERLDAATNVWVAELGLPVFTFSLCCVVK